MVEKEALFDYTVLVSENDDNVSGFIAFNDEEIAWLYVHPDMYRKGVGKALTDEVIASSKNYYTIEVLQGNTNALEFYKARGFKEIGIESGKMPGNESFSVTVHILNNETNV